MKIIRGKTKPRGLRIVIYGVHGIGKTTLAAKLPNNLFLDFENGTHGLDVAKVDESDLPKSYTAMKGLLEELTRDHQGFERITIDTADKFEQNLSETLAKEKGVEDVFAVNDYGRTIALHKGGMSSVLDKATDLVNSGMDVIVLAHETPRKCEPLEGKTGTYDHHELKLSKTVSPIFTEWADVVIFTAYKTFLVEGEKKGDKAHVEGGKRWAFCSYSNDWDAKHRASVELPDDCSLDKLVAILPGVIANAVDRTGGAAVKPVESKPSGEEAAKAALAKKRAAAAAKSAEPKAEPTKAEPSPASAAEAPKVDVPELPAAAKEFVKLLKQYEIPEEKMREYAAGKLNERYGVDFKTLDLAEWPTDALMWLNRGFDKIAPKLK